MTYPRRLLVRPGRPGVYHCVSRCVRRAFLCGRNRDSGRSFEHRRQWIEDRIVELAGEFAVAVHAYAVMSNHFPVVIEVVPHAAERWTDEEVARRCVRRFPARDGTESGDERRIEAARSSPERIAVLRERPCDGPVLAARYRHRPPARGMRLPARVLTHNALRHSCPASMVQP